MSIDDIIDILAVGLIGVVPDDEKIVVSTNRRTRHMRQQIAGRAGFQEYCQKDKRREIPFMSLTDDQVSCQSSKITGPEGKLKGRYKMLLDLRRLFGRAKIQRMLQKG